MAPTASSRLLDPEVAARIRKLQLLSREAVERALTGVHRSNLHGSSIEFTEHKEYSWGDDVRNVDWKQYGKSDRYYVKQFEHETAVPTHLVLDASGSMRYGSGEIAKWDYAIGLAAALAYLLVGQKDPVGLAAIDRKIRDFIPPRGRRDHLHVLLEAMAALEPEGPTSLVESLEALATRMKRRGMIFVISDLMDPDADFIKHLAHLRHRRNDITVFHVADPAELEFPFSELTEFEDMESPQRLLVDPKELREEYLTEIGAFLEKVRKGCSDNRIEYRLTRTDEPIANVIAETIARRERGA